ncbi:AAA family ATPase [Amycolatopsis cihanbeyliensis]|uniref:AAA domain-containing protein n=1 Tax=Amycolatopsis cihanbeyliensis TaxID=1128664 RepID=A0A542DME9_AMYCI|nr:AAA family ATPase [Amycolatopsis cihanbeyliensis]TQJ04272.1 AAA domain-containing protein [Amycolatopsis cihanbeyliensis]
MIEQGSAEQWADRDGIVHDGPEGDRPRRVRSQRVSEIPLKRRTFLWENRVPLGEVTVWAGHAGIGKSQAAVWLAAEVSRGRLPGDVHGQPAPVLYLGTEDSWSYTLAPRFVAAGADLDRVHRLYAETVEGQEAMISLAVDLDELRAEMIATGARLVVLDALLSTMTGADLVKQGVVRRYLEPLTRLAQDLNIAVVGVAHFRKAGGTEPLQMISGSAEFGQVVRSAIGFARDAEAEDGSCVMSIIKTNIAPQGLPSLRYRIDAATVDTPDGPTDVGRFVPLGETDQHVRDFIDQPGTGDGDDGEDIRGWLHSYLARQGGAVEPEEVIKAGRAAGYSPDQLKRAKKPKGTYPKVHSRKAGMDDGWVWSLEPSTEDEGSTKEVKGATPGAPLPSHSSALPSSSTDQSHPSPAAPQLTLVTGEQPCDRCRDTPTRVDNAGNRYCRTCAPHLWQDTA